MSQEVITANESHVVQAQQQPMFSAKATMPTTVNHGAVSIESERAIAEARGQMQLAKMFPRDNNSAYAELMESCKLPALAKVAFYNVPRGGGTVSGPSIRLAEEIARVYGNFQYGHRELSRSPGKSEVEVFSWDVERNNRSIRQITVEHVIDTKNGPKILRDQKDIDDRIANIASKQVRGRILALLPKWMVEAAVTECKKTLAGNNEEPLSVRVRKMTQEFAKFGVTTAHLEHHLGHSLDEVLSDEIVDLIGIFNAIREGASPSDFFGAAEKDDANTKSAEAIKAATAAGASQQQKEQKEPPKNEQKRNPAQNQSNPVKEGNQPAAQEKPAATAQPKPTAAAEPEDVF